MTTVSPLFTVIEGILYTSCGISILVSLKCGMSLSNSQNSLLVAVVLCMLGDIDDVDGDDVGGDDVGGDDV